MEDTTRLKLILLGLFLAALSLGYFVFVQKANEQKKTSQVTQIQQIEPSENVPTPTIALSAGSTGTLGQTTKGGQGSVRIVDELPKTGVPAGLIAIFSLSGAIIGWSLQKFPK
ncbi:hypothetical protein A3F00_04990 [Candidatus Daviesbacteria bacterium RIFCSPHIGHO2_12_FULL_37_11]|uniref:Uncharacterized protein n=1 Tax=Candidatus Daviesbacteria bacterium RIFCSPHIGHO2_12_FULL_37_11 TaxID=1797777 RepID=A0A1F5K9G0_9BACT|nr:MAG: hypothetical protein A2111_02590 [Candidatus Daviesbacteria bacterium GWA1_38_6]OGE37593.1 MAG: hypothetical protein A3F00_04990 [Candidatus Daviesbacteria bacterium RIFCSPHIGHO2_12_FULL_37_11]OGE46030.1 MAG: hypothetical protein A3B39_03410 [Candidatus Daviesbacteria bacterium RIFCSPLOWO2_01_FULL_37_10]